MAGESSGLTGYCVLKPGGGTQAYVPMLEGSRCDDPQAFEKDFVAMGVPDATTWFARHRKPALLINTRLYGGTGNWFVLSRLTAMLLPNISTAAFPGSGLLETNLGPVQWRHANEASPREWTGCKLALMTLRGRVQDEGPVDCSMLLLPYGAEQAATALSVAAPPFGRLPYMSNGVAFTGFADVSEWTLTFNNFLKPDNTGVTPDGSGKAWPSNYFNSRPPECTFDVTRKFVASPTFVAPGASAPSSAVITLQDPTLTGTMSVIFTLSLMPFDRTKSVTFDLAMIRDTYQTVMSASTASGAKVAIAAGT